MNTGSGRAPRSRCLSTVWPWASYLTSLNLRVLPRNTGLAQCRMEPTEVPGSRGVAEFTGDFACEELGRVL